MSKYKAWIQTEVSSYNNLTIGEMPIPSLGENEILVKTEASTLNYADLLLSSGLYQSNPEPPFVPGFEVAGTVVEANKESGFNKGDRVVAATTVFRSGRYGSFGEYCITSERLCYKIPDEISSEVGAAMLMAYLTSDFAIHRRGGIKEGDTILVNAAAGGVGLAAVQLAKLAGARVIAAVGSETKRELVQKYEPDLVINYQEENLKETIEEAYGKRPLDLFYDQVGGEHYEDGVRLLGSEGRALIVGFASGNIPSQLLSYVLVKNISITGVFMINFEFNGTEYLRERMKLIFDLYIKKEIDPVFEVIKFDQIVEYLELMGSRKTVGRIVAIQ
jgi:NADPH2:quinone reductase